MPTDNNDDDDDNDDDTMTRTTTAMMTAMVTTTAITQQSNSVCVNLSSRLVRPFPILEVTKPRWMCLPPLAA